MPSVQSVLVVRRDRNQSLRQPPDKLEPWLHGPLFCFCPEREVPLWETSSLLHHTSIMLHWGRGMDWHAKLTRFPTYPFSWISSWLYIGLDDVASQLVSRVLTEVFWSIHTLLLTWFLCGGRRACVFLVHHLDLNWIPHILMIILFK